MGERRFGGGVALCVFYCGVSAEIVSDGAYIDSFGRRRGRKLRTRKQELLSDLLPTVAIDLENNSSLTMKNVFGNDNPLWLELGFGSGEHLIAQASRYPDINFIGCEPYLNGVAGLLGQLEKMPLNNLKLYADDARLVLERMGGATLDRMFILFPDPWPKIRHHKRRIISSGNLALFAHVLKSGAVLRVATDHAEYATWILEHMLACKDFTWTAQKEADWNNPPEDWIPTRYEMKARSAGRLPVYLDFIRAPANLQMMDEPMTDKPGISSVIR